MYYYIYIVSTTHNDTQTQTRHNTPKNDYNNMSIHTFNFDLSTFINVGVLEYMGVYDVGFEYVLNVW